MFKGFRTYLFALALAVEPVFEAALLRDSVDLQMLGRQLLIAAVVVALRTITTTPPGAKE